MQSRKITEEIKCRNTEEIAFEYCEYEGKRESTEYQNFHTSLDYLNINWGNS